MDILKLHNITFSYNEDIIIENINLNLKKDERISIVGSSGCGKTTLLKIIAGIENNFLGTISSSKIAYMPQKDLLLPWRNIISNILLPIELNKGDLNKGKIKALNFLDKLNLMNYAYKFPNELSGGMKQRVSFLRTIITESDTLLLDEPFSALDAITKEDLQHWLLDIIKDLKKSMVFITHDINEAIFLSNRILVCKNKPMNQLIEFKVKKNITSTELKELKENILKIIREG
ncbi:ABC transporter ATP-binding protein [uncultured Cetobacterium sp.]|uniref:ABC transporter ATP-binding protein n=2 Tax=uncultured Cetobacterium sp. TaxID=527638 RepID=UPI002639E4AD|nr:ABC transporter ATP-binding protein [uncultured Cetobacterium sp.]